MAEPTNAESSNQLVVALAIVGVLGMLGMGLIIGGIMDKNWADLGVGIGAIVGALSNALAAPSGVSSVIRASKTPPDAT